MDYAFPSGNHRDYEPTGGMELRDYFAAQVMASQNVLGCGIEKRIEIAKHAYRIADTMLEVRKLDEIDEPITF